MTETVEPYPGGDAPKRVRVSRQRRRGVVLRLLRGEDLDSISRSLDVSTATLAKWRDAFLAEIERDDAVHHTGGRSPTEGTKTPLTQDGTADKNPDDNGTAQSTSMAVLSAAVKEFSESGFAGARIDRIAAAAGVNKTALYYHFGNKDELFAAALEYGYSQFYLLGRWNRKIGPSVVADLEQLVGAIFDSVSANRQHASLISDENRHGGKHLSPALRTRIHRLIEPVIEDLGALIKRGQQMNALRDHLDVVRIYLSIISLSMFYLTHATTLSVTVGVNLSDPNEIARWRAHVIELIIAALKKR